MITTLKKTETLEERIRKKVEVDLKVGNDNLGHWGNNPTESQHQKQ